MFDTGSPMVYILTDSCSKSLCPQEVKYGPNGSGSYKQDFDGINEPLAHCYGKGCVSGSVSKDKFCFSEGNKNCITNTVFLAVNEATDIEND